ncbi:MAG: GSCFA domain-containing protein, partial [Bacteroidaceae bacterium]|nr:GSCFA domain-containing protein [Bacteroidaceae bacterium]
MKLQTTVDIPRKELALTYKDSILCMGSCFADEIGKRLENCYFDTMVNPFGVLFNPLSISNALGLMEGYGINSYGCSFVEQDVIKTPAGYCSFHHHGSFTKESPEEFLSNANQKLANSSDFFYRQGWVIVTLGTAYVYRHNETGMVVSNCHKLPSSQFTRSILTVDNVVNAL